MRRPSFCFPTPFRASPTVCARGHRQNQALPGKGPLRALAGVALTVGGLATAPLQAEVDPSGTYVYLQQTVTETRLPVLENVIAKTRAVSIQRLSAEGGRLRGPGKICSLRLESNSKLVQTSFPRAFVRALPDVTVDLALDGDTATGRPHTLVLGARLQNPEGDPLPDDADDERVFDQDRDGNPGMTVNVTGFVSGDVYVVQRSTTRLEGKRKGKRIQGGLDFALDQSVVGASKSLLKKGPKPIPDPAQSFFRMQKVSDTITCAEADRLAHGWR